MTEQFVSRVGFFLAVTVIGAAPAACGGTGASLPPDETAGGAGGAMTAPPPSYASAPTGGATTAPTASTAPVNAVFPEFPGSTVELCPGAPVLNLPVETFEPCQMIGCAAAHCVPEVAVPDSVPIEMLGRCADVSTVCVPDDYTAALGMFSAKTCASIMGAEGRCISTCIPQVNGLMDALPQGDCGANERCAPCINPNDGSETGACTQGCDPGPSAETLAAPIIFAACSNGEGRCTPKEIIPELLLSHLVQATCPTVDFVCSPIEKSQNLKYNFPECTPTDPFVAALIAGTPGPNGQLGGCVPAWLADSNLLEGAFLHPDGCAAGDKCAPCNNPLRNFIPTGACAVPLPTDPSGGMPPDGVVVAPPPATGGVPGTGGMIGTGAVPGTGGMVGTGGTIGTGGFIP